MGYVRVDERIKLKLILKQKCENIQRLYVAQVKFFFKYDHGKEVSGFINSHTHKRTLLVPLLGNLSFFRGEPLNPVLS